MGAVKPDWHTAPDWARWLAQDRDGRWTWYSAKPVIDEDAQRWVPGSQRNTFEPAVMHPPSLQPLGQETREGYVWRAVSANGAESFHRSVPYYDWHHHEWMTRFDEDRRLALGDDESWDKTLEEAQDKRYDSASRAEIRRQVTEQKRIWKYRVIE